MTELMTMRDIAGLARVQRPVVTMWRSRSRAQGLPFPSACDRRAGQELFRREDVVAWLEETQRGKNPEVRADAAAHTRFVSSAEDAEVLSALICLRQLVGDSLSGLESEDLLDHADEHDPDDRYFRREIEHCADLPAAAQRCDELVEASWSAAPAHQRLVESWLRLPGSELGRAAVADSARQLLLSLLGALAADLGQPLLMDPTGAAVDLLAEAAASLDLPVRVLDGDSAAHRLTRRQLLLAGAAAQVIARGEGDWSVAGPTVHLVVLPSAADPAMDALAQLELLDEIGTQMTPDQVVVCLAPAATLADPLLGSASNQRDQLLREGRVRAVVRLPAGLRPAQPREHSALWLLGSPDLTPTSERRTLVADLGAVSLAHCDGLVDDLLAAWQGREGARRRTWAHLHPVFTADLVSASGTLVPSKPHRMARERKAGADWVVELRAADAAGRLKAYRFDVMGQPGEEVTVAQALKRGWLRVLPGRKVELSGLPEGSVPVVADPHELTQPQRVDRLALRTRTDHELTEPGDIIFTVRPRPHSVVDDDGGTLVLAPARVLRVHPSAPLVRQAVAARINAATSNSWRAWPLAVVPESTRDVLGEALTDLAAERARLVAELAALDALAVDLTAAVESRQLSITKPSNTEENHGPTSH